jgi:hypothetical protein
VVRAVSGPRECCTDRRNFGQDPGEETMNDQVKLDEIAPALSAKEAENMITTNLPPIDHHGETVEQVGRNSIRVRLPYDRKFMGTEPWQDGSGQVFSGPVVMAVDRESRNLAATWRYHRALER